MSKEQKSNKETKKKAVLSQKEKRQVKKAKTSSRPDPFAKLWCSRAVARKRPALSPNQSLLPRKTQLIVFLKM